MMHSSPIASVDELFQVLQRGGSTAYFGEPVSVLDHSLQTAWFVQGQAADGNADQTLIAAALLHDLGHLLHSDGEDAAQHGLDTRHEERAAALLEGHLPVSVLDPIRMHVAAKRYLCFANPGYLSALSPASLQSLRLQGGPMTILEAQDFLSRPHAPAALALRRADDAAKIDQLRVPNLGAYRSLIVAIWK
jgi:predicted HD phosphohydrolase